MVTLFLSKERVIGGLGSRHTDHVIGVTTCFLQRNIKLPTYFYP